MDLKKSITQSSFVENKLAHFVPVKPGKQVQVNIPLLVTEQMPLFIQGLELHGLNCMEHVMPVKPGVHTQ
jgi:hypothetical protein